MKVKVLVADKFPDQYIKQMKDLDLEVTYSPKLGENDLPGAIGDAVCCLHREAEEVSDAEASN